MATKCVPWSLINPNIYFTGVLLQLYTPVKYMLYKVYAKSRYLPTDKSALRMKGVHGISFINNTLSAQLISNLNVIQIGL